MPGTDVFEIADRLHRMRPNLRFLFHCAHVKDGYLAATYDAGACDFDGPIVGHSSPSRRKHRSLRADFDGTGDGAGTLRTTAAHPPLYWIDAGRLWISRIRIGAPIRLVTTPSGRRPVPSGSSRIAVSLASTTPAPHNADPSTSGP